ncbi:tetratricopeptide (TPR) repeat protein [Haloferula luteola]|uniref:Tetratricopeptide (TPR) repeat protein n=1 Tax=Haloferula luteola TaxID=595692 RepID=A0A840V783_9BACT|nr:hypothetical protein [Haloferula luteola]MBB5351454.1 tetratricopeptide (TPR) repeat protein [Haloferula luteola]
MNPNFPLSRDPGKCSPDKPDVIRILTLFECKCTGIVLALAFAISFQLLMVCYSPSLRGPFLFDDIEAIPGNADFRMSFNPTVFFRDHESSLQFDRRPVTGMISWIDFQVSGLHPFGYRMTNLVLHFTTGCVGFLLLSKLAKRFNCACPKLLALCSAILWMLHPLPTNAVSFIYQRAEVIMSLFLMVGLLCLLIAEERSSRRWLGLAGACGILSALSKESGVVFIAIAPIFESFVHFPTWRSLGKQRGWYYLILGAIFVAIIGWIFTGIRTKELGESGVFWETPLGYLRFQCSAIFKYLRLIFWPSSLNFFSLPLGWGEAKRWLPALIFLMLIGAMVLLGGRRRRWLWLAAIVFLGVLAPTSSLLPLTLEPYAEFRMYLPSLVIVGVMVALLGSLLVRALSSCSFVLNAVSCALIYMSLLGVLSAATWSRNHVYSSPVLLWEDVVLQEPMNGKALANLGIAHLQVGNNDKAEWCAKSLIGLGERGGAPDVKFAGERLLALIELDQGKVEDAIGILEIAANLTPDIPGPQIEYALALTRLGRHSEAQRIVDERLPGNARVDPSVQLLIAEIAMRRGEVGLGHRVLDRLESELPGNQRVHTIRELANQSVVADEAGRSTIEGTAKPQDPEEVEWPPMAPYSSNAGLSTPER